MKRYIAYRLAAAFCCLASLGSVYAQSIKTFDREVCPGASIYLNGGLYQILSNDCEVTSIKADGTGAELYRNNGKERIVVTATTEYHIVYKDNANPGGTVEKVTITVIAPPTLKVTVTDPKPLPAAFCKGTRVTLTATSNTDVYWTLSSDDTYSKKGTSDAFTLTESCRISAQSYNACGFVDTSLYFPVITAPDLSDARLILNTSINGTFCMECGFFPKADEIVTGATQGTVKTSSVTWEDGSTTEETIKAGSFSKKVKVHAVVEQSAGTCGASSTVSRTIDTVITLTVSGGKDCKPTMQTTVSVKPCRDGEVQLRNYNKNLCTLQGSPTLTADPAHPKIVIQQNKDFRYDLGNGQELYRWNVRWEDYDKTDAQPSLTANAGYSIACPYSTSKPTITGTLAQKVNVTIDTSYLTFKYEYCPDGKATLEITGQKDIVGLNDVTLVKPAESVLNIFSQTGKEGHQWIFSSREPITTALLPKYAEIKVKVKFGVRDGNCDFSLEREETLRLKQKNGCTMEFQMEQTGACIGESRTFKLAHATDAVADYIEVDPHPVFTFKVDAQQRTMEPYYAGAPAVSSVEDNITATIYYHMQGSSETLSMTKEFPLKVDACPPTINDAVRINSASCPTCPGAEMRGTVYFKNPTTKEKDLKVEMISTSVNKKGASEKYAANKREYTVHRYLFGDMDYRIAVTYNEGDSIYMNPKMSFTVDNRGEKEYGESVTAESIRMAGICGHEKEVQPDSVCAGERVDLYVYSRNFLYDTLKDITWGDPSVQPVGTGIEEWANYQYTDNKGTVRTKKIKRFHYQVVAQGSGIYPFLMSTKIRDSVIERRDTIRVAVLAKPRIFVQDTVYACSNAPVDLWKYVDSSSVDVTTLTCSGGGMSIASATDNDYRTATATMRYTCSQKNITEKITIKTQDPVYNAFIPDTACCTGGTVTLHAETNGRVTWTRRHRLAGGGLSQADTLRADMENSVFSDPMGESDQLYIVTARTGCDKPPFQTVQFWAEVKQGPTLSIQDVDACGSETVTLGASYNTSEAGPVSWKVDGNPVTQPYVQSPTPSRDCTVKVEGTVTGTIAGVNDCPSSATAQIRFYASPTVAIQGKNSTGGLCVDSGVSARIQAQGDASHQYEWFLKASPGTKIGTGAVLNHAFQKDTLVYVVVSNSGTCTAADTVRIVLNGKRRTVADTTVCVGSQFSFSMPWPADASYRWYGPDGTPICPCADIAFPGPNGFTAADAGTYRVEILRNGCTVTQNIDIRAYPVPEMDFGTTADPVPFCAGSRLMLQLQPKVDGKEVGGYFEWQDPAGNDVGDGSNTYVKDPVLMVDRGPYTVFVTLEDGCIHSASVNVRVDDHTQPAFSLRPYYCEGDTAGLNAAYQGAGTTYEWFSGAGFRLGPADNLYDAAWPGLTPQASGPLYLVVTRGACQDTAYRDLEVRERPAAGLEVQGGRTLDGTLYFCEGDVAMLALRHSRPGDTCLWLLPDRETLEASIWETDSVRMSDGGSYSVVVRRNGCASEAETVNLDVRAVPVLVLQDTFLCQGREIVVNVENADYPGAVYTWRELSVQAPEVRLDRAGEYHIVMDLRGCSDEGGFLISERPVPEWDFPSDTSICNRDSLLLQGPEGMESYLWQDGSTGREFLVRSAGLYSLAVSLAGCANEKSVYVETEFCSPVFFPSAFTPNGDGINDAFGPISLAEEGELEYAFFVYNANGQLVFQSTDLRSSWNGTFKGQPCPAGIYTYRCRIVVAESGRDLSRTGTVHLIR